MVRLALRLLLTLLAAGPAAPALAQIPSTSPGTIYRVFLNDGQALPSYGEAARVDDRVVFNLLLHRTAADQQLQLVSLPAAAVDLPRTARYAEAMRASFYAATRGEADYTAMTGEIAATLDQIARTTEVAARLQLAERARQRLLTWSREHYGYREGDVRELIDLFDALLTELRTGTGQAAFAFDLVAGGGTTAREPLLPAPTTRESITLALAAARAADIPEERLAILQGAGRAAAAASAGDLAARVAAELLAGRAPRPPTAHWRPTSRRAPIGRCRRETCWQSSGCAPSSWSAIGGWDRAGRPRSPSCCARCRRSSRRRAPIVSRSITMRTFARVCWPTSAASARRCRASTG
jgi:hypothetical protein